MTLFFLRRLTRVVLIVALLCLVVGYAMPVSAQQPQGATTGTGSISAPSSAAQCEPELSQLRRRLEQADADQGEMAKRISRYLAAYTQAERVAGERLQTIRSMENTIQTLRGQTEQFEDQLTRLAIANDALKQELQRLQARGQAPQDASRIPKDPCVSGAPPTGLRTTLENTPAAIAAHSVPASVTADEALARARIAFPAPDAPSADHEDAAFWLRIAVLKGSPLAASVLGTLYAYGEGVPKDLTTAEQLWQLAALQGESFAAYNLGVLYASDHPSHPADQTTARFWYKIAAEHGNSRARTALQASRTGP